MLATDAKNVFDGPLNPSQAHAVAEFRRVLDTHGFAGPAVPEALGKALPVAAFHRREDLPLYQRRLAAPTPINVLIKLFVLDRWVDEAAARMAIAPLALEDVRTMGLVEEGPRGVKARVRLSGYCDLVLAHDRADEQLAALHQDHVLDVNPTTVTLANLTVRRPARSALDIGTGCGVLAMLAARHSERVVAVDTNPRALNFAAFNARLNGLDNVECRQGSLFDPVEGERFDLIVCNPPYVISPESRYLFRDGGRRGDAFCEELVRRVPEYLEEGGFASILCNWALHPGEAVDAPVRRWVERSGCDAWLLWSSTPDPLEYAAMWNRRQDRATYDDAIERWTAYFAELGISAIGVGGVILRRRKAGPNWMRADQLPDGSLGAGDAHIQRIFRAEDRLSTVPDDEHLLQQAFVVADDHRLHQTLAFRAGEYVIERAEVQLEGGLRFSGSVDRYAMTLLARCDGTRTLGDIATELAEKGGMAREQVARACAALARRLASLGFLIPVD